MNTNFMNKAIELSQQKMREGCGGPFGALIVKNGLILSEGWNQVTSTNDPTAHAEMVAIRRATAELGRFDLQGCEIYSSCEPCPMCLAAIYWARLDKLYFANNRNDAAAIGFDDEFLYSEITKPQSERQIPTFYVPSPSAKAVFLEWQNKIDKISY